MRQHRFDFLRRQARQQGVEEHDALVGAEAGEVGVAVRAALGAVHHEQALGGEADALHQAFDARFQAVVGQRREFVEQRRDHGRVQHHHQQLEAAPDHPRIQPPQLAGLVHQRQDDPDQRQADGGAEQHALDHVGHPQADRHLVEAEALLQHELAGSSRTAGRAAAL